MDSIIIENLTKKFGTNTVLNEVCLNINTKTFGILGREGSGKTTLIKILSTILTKTSGNIKINNMQIENRNRIRKIIGYLPNDFSFNANINIYEFMDYLAILSEIPKKIRKEKIHDSLKKVNLDDCYKLKVKSLPNGLKRNLGLAQAILHEPKILLIDEPTYVLPPEDRARFRALIKDLSQDKIALICTENLADIEKLCENIAILNSGEIAYSGLLKNFIGSKASLEDAYINLIGGCL